MRKFTIILGLTLLLVMSVSGAALAYDPDYKGDRTAQLSTECGLCHAGEDGGTYGPHGDYATSTDKCGTCHDVHANSGNAQLLPGSTLTAACNYCHDLTATWAGPYNMSGNMTVAAAHRVVGIAVNDYTDTEGFRNSKIETADAGVTDIPGSNVTNGGEGELNTSMQGELSGSVFTCNSCHTPHGVKSVKPYLGESNVKVNTTKNVASPQWKIYMTNRILKRNPNTPVDSVATSPTMYGSAWCLDCHEGRDTLTQQGMYNHPVNENAPAYKFLELAEEQGMIPAGKTIDQIVADNVIVVGPAGDTTAEVMGDPRSNQQYAMTQYDELDPDYKVDDQTTWPLAVRPDGYTAITNYVGGPSCQQCHGSARDVEQAFSLSKDPAISNPFRGNFPHVSNFSGLLVEQKDDFCTNCHAPSILP